jgi:integrase/recombinase XerD
MEKTATNLTLEELITKARVHLESLGYTKETMKHFMGAWTTLWIYAQAANVTHFTTEFGHKFLKEKYAINPFDVNLASHKRTVRRAIAVLIDYQLSGIIYKRQLMKLHQWFPEYRDICEEFLDSYVRDRLAKGTARLFRLNLEKLTAYLINGNVKSIGDVTPRDIECYVSTYIGYAKETLSYAMYVLRCFFKYAFENNYTATDLSAYPPTIKINPKANIPSVFNVDEIERLLKAVDRGNPMGKRDYAILLLAVRYGMRVGEITALQLNNLNFETRTINYLQSKTGNSMKSDMLKEVGWALIDYLKNGRPKTSSSNVFVRQIPPFDSFGENNNLHHIMSKYLNIAKIKVPRGNKSGIHTLRHSLASNLLEQGVPLHVISDVLGHLELNSTTIYTKIDLSQLSLCALEVPYEAN